jgi:hypothetical protein
MEGSINPLAQFKCIDKMILAKHRKEIGTRLT